MLVCHCCYGRVEMEGILMVNEVLAVLAHHHNASPLIRPLMRLWYYLWRSKAHWKWPFKPPRFIFHQPRGREKAQKGNKLSLTKARRQCVCVQECTHLSRAEPWVWLLVSLEKTFRSFLVLRGGEEGGVQPSVVLVTSRRFRRVRKRMKWAKN